MKHKQTPLLRSATLLTGVNIATTAATLISGLYIARQLDTQAYGQYAYMANIFLLATLFLGFGLTGQIAKDVAEREHVTPALLQRQVSGLVTLRIATAACAALCGVGLWLLSGEIAYGYAGTAAALFMYGDFVVGILSGLQRLRRVALLLSVQPLAYLAAVLLLPIDGITAVYNLFIVSHVASAVCGTLLLGGLPELSIRPGIAAIKQLDWRAMVAGHVYLAVLLQTAYGSYGITLLGGLKHYSAAGEMSIAFTIVRMLPLLSGTLISVVYYPRLCALYKSGALEQLKSNAMLVYDLATIAAAGCTALLLIYSDTIVPLLYTERHAAAIPLLQMLAVMSFFGVTDQVLTWTLIAGNQSWRALQPLLVRMALLLLSWPLTLLDSTLLPQIIALAYIGSSAVGWLLQLHHADLIPLRRSIVVTAIMCLAGLGIGLGVRWATDWIAYAEIGALLVSAALYGLGGLLLIRHRLALHGALAAKRV